MHASDQENNSIDTRKLRAVKVTVEVEMDDGGFLRHVYLDTWQPYPVTIKKVSPPHKGETGRVEISIPRWPTTEQSHPGRDAKVENVNVNPDVL